MWWKILLIIGAAFLMFLFGCVTTQKTTTPTSVKDNMKLVTDTIQKTSEAVDILSDDTLSVEGRVRLYLKRMEEINKKLIELTDRYIITKALNNTRFVEKM